MVGKCVTRELLNQMCLIGTLVTVDGMPCHDEELNKLILPVLVIFDQSERKREMTLVNFIYAR